MANRFQNLQALVNALAALAELQAAIDEIIAIVGAMGGIIIPPCPDPLTHANAQTWKNEMEANWIAAGSPEPPGGG